MAFQHTWRWFGPEDPVTLEDIRQTGATGVVTALHQIPTGVVWSVAEIERRKALIESAQLQWSVVESVPVHESIKSRTGPFREHISNYARTIENLGRCGIQTLCYNFMTVFDWSRTDIRTVFTDGSVTNSFTEKLFAVFELFLLQRKGAEADYSPDVISEANQTFSAMSISDKETLVETILLGFPGSGEAYTLDGLRKALARFSSIDTEQLRAHLVQFLREIVPEAERSGVLLAIHPDDPPWPLLGLPRAVSTAQDLRHILGAVDSPSNGITFCTGSLGASRENDVPAMAEEFARRVNFVHLRNVRSSGRRDFVEDNHLEGNVDMFRVVRSLLFEQRKRSEAGMQRPQLPMRPDHGHLMRVDEKRGVFYPGYSLFGRMRGLAELRGLEHAIEQGLQK